LAQDSIGKCGFSMVYMGNNGNISNFHNNNSAIKNLRSGV
jgi:hypothetical protein